MVGYNYLGTSFVFWIAGGLTVVALLPVQFPDLSDATQVTTWVVLAIFYLLAWFVLLKPPGTRKKNAGASKLLFIGEKGQLVESTGQTDTVLIKFPHSIQGQSKWPIIPLGEMKIGDQVVVVDIIGQSLLVEKSDSTSETSTRS